MPRLQTFISRAAGSRAQAIVSLPRLQVFLSSQRRDGQRLDSLTIFAQSSRVLPTSSKKRGPDRQRSKPCHKVFFSSQERQEGRPSLSKIQSQIVVPVPQSSGVLLVDGQKLGPDRIVVSADSRRSTAPASGVLLEGGKRGAQIVVGLVRGVGHQLVHLEPLLGRVLVAHLEGLVVRLLVVQRLEANIRHVSAADALRYPVFLQESPALPQHQGLRSVNPLWTYSSWAVYSGSYNLGYPLSGCPTLVVQFVCPF